MVREGVRPALLWAESLPDAKTGALHVLRRSSGWRSPRHSHTPGSPGEGQPTPLLAFPWLAASLPGRRALPSHSPGGQLSPRRRSGEAKGARVKLTLLPQKWFLLVMGLSAWLTTLHFSLFTGFLEASVCLPCFLRSCPIPAAWSVLQGSVLLASLSSRADAVCP